MEVSVVIPTHGRADLLGATLNSVINQTYKNTEIIVVSDGHDEDTDRLMESYKNKKNISYYFYQEAKGANYARNLGVEKSKNEIISFLDDDDQWENSKLELQVQLMQSDSDIGLVYTGNIQRYIDSQVSFNYIPKEEGDLSEKIFFRNYIGSTSSVLMKKDIFYNAGKFDENLNAMQDYDLWIRACQLTKVGVVPKPLLIYNNDRTRPQISSQINKYIEAGNIIKSKHIDYLRIKPKLNDMFEIFILEVLIKKSLRSGGNKEARGFAKTLLRKKKSVQSLISFLATYFSYDFSLRIKSLLSR